MRRTGWGTAQRRGDEDWFDEANAALMERMKPTDTRRAGTKPEPDEKVPAVDGTLVHDALRRDECNGYYVVDRTMMEGES